MKPLDPRRSHVLYLYTEIKDIINVLELDAYKSARGNGCAGLRVRRGLRELKRNTHKLLCLLIELDRHDYRLKRQAKMQEKYLRNPVKH